MRTWDERKLTLMAYCRLDEIEGADVLLLQRTYDAAVARLEQSGIRQPVEGTPRAALFDSLVDAIVLDNWDNRGTQTEVTLPENRSFRLILNQMKQTEPVSKLDTGGGA